ncbi:MAG TPA: hypothetical protein VFF73_29540, partial [Planctomycetota bacterium]|nr:hypothetical protein [Planctomycetota bacterium]
MDDELRAAQRAYEESKDGPALEAYVALLRRAGRIDDVVDVLHEKTSRSIRAQAKFLGHIAAGRRLIVGKGQWGERVGVVDVDSREQ